MCCFSRVPPFCGFKGNQKENHHLWGPQQSGTPSVWKLGQDRTPRILAKRFPDAEVLGITLSPQQAHARKINHKSTRTERRTCPSPWPFSQLCPGDCAESGWEQTIILVPRIKYLVSPAVIKRSLRQAERAANLAKKAGLKNVRFQVMDALNMESGAWMAVLPIENSAVGCQVRRRLL